jgi:hypothetical protein
LKWKNPFSLTRKYEGNELHEKENPQGFERASVDSKDRKKVRGKMQDFVVLQQDQCV